MDKAFFQDYFMRYPSLFLYLMDDVDSAKERVISEPAPWAESLYDAAELSLQEALENVEGSLHDYLQAVEVKAGVRSIELERTLLNLIALDKVVQDDYEGFIQIPVAAGEPLSRKSFQRLTKMVQELYPSEKIKLLETKLVMAGYGKVRILRLQMKNKYDLVCNDQDDFMQALYQLPQDELSSIFPSLKQLSSSEYEHFQKSQTGFHFGHMAHATVSASGLSDLKILIEGGDAELVRENLLMQLFIVAGATGHVGGKTMLSDEIFGIYVDCILKTLLELTSHSVSEVYQHYLARRVRFAGLDLPQNVDMDAHDIFAHRMLCMLRIIDGSEWTAILNEIQALWEDAEFDADVNFIESYQFHHLTPTYMPVVVNGIKQHYDNNKNGKSEVQRAVKKSIHIIASALRLHEDLLESQDLDEGLRANFNELGHVILTQPEYIDSINSERDLVMRKDDGAMFPKTHPDFTQHQENYYYS